ncbi:hypothetical protein [Methylosinus sp. Sm6]|uniref:hypothetical protein n=1 Tax=Methylosinus sp. Sm6 TaxID=2866948 RepID=UPI001C98FE34|nr:hypothetical protein [Methylosinus sp. Sm6]MBY6244022.1 hypothetical protein [Methylosinus sp. Sm6]
MAALVSLADIVIWLKVARPHGDLDAVGWGVAPLRKIVDVTTQIDLLSFGADAVLASDETRSKFSAALAELRASATTILRADIAVYFADDRAAQNFLLPPDLMKLVGHADEIEISVYRTES